VSRIFISYRKTDSAAQAQKLYQRLSAHFKGLVGIDLAIRPGDDWEKAIETAVGSCDVLIVVIGKRWLTAADERGHRLPQEDDWVRREIETALNRGITVIPFLVNKAPMPGIKELPKELIGLASKQAVREPNLADGVLKLIEVLPEDLAEKAAKAATVPAETGPPQPTAGRKHQKVSSPAKPIDRVPDSNKQTAAQEAQRRPAKGIAEIGTAAYLFAGHAVGAAAQFRRLDDVTNLNHVVPALASSAIAVTGGLSNSRASHYVYTVDYPRRRTLLSVERADSIAFGQEVDDRGEAETDAQVESLAILEKLRVASARVHFVSSLDPESDTPKVATKGCQIDGLQLGRVMVRLQLDEEALAHCGSMRQLAEFYRDQPSVYHHRDAWRFGVAAGEKELPLTRRFLRCSLVRQIQVLGPEADLQDLSVNGNQIVWRGFGRITLGEVMIDCVGPHVAMIRLAMGSDAAGSATICEGHCAVLRAGGRMESG